MHPVKTSITKFLRDGTLLVRRCIEELSGSIVIQWTQCPCLIYLSSVEGWQPKCSWGLFKGLLRDWKHIAQKDLVKKTGKSGKDKDIHNILNLEHWLRHGITQVIPIWQLFSSPHKMNTVASVSWQTDVYSIAGTTWQAQPSNQAVLLGLTHQQKWKKASKSNTAHPDLLIMGSVQVTAKKLYRKCLCFCYLALIANTAVQTIQHSMQMLN